MGNELSITDLVTICEDGKISKEEINEYKLTEKDKAKEALKDYFQVTLENDSTEIKLNSSKVGGFEAWLKENYPEDAKGVVPQLQSTTPEAPAKTTPATPQAQPVTNPVQPENVQKVTEVAEAEEVKPVQELKESQAPMQVEKTVAKEESVFKKAIKGCIRGATLGLGLSYLLPLGGIGKVIVTGLFAIGGAIANILKKTPEEAPEQEVKQEAQPTTQEPQPTVQEQAPVVLEESTVEPVTNPFAQPVTSEGAGVNQGAVGNNIANGGVNVTSTLTEVATQQKEATTETPKVEIMKKTDKKETETDKAKKDKEVKSTENFDKDKKVEKKQEEQESKGDKVPDDKKKEEKK